jgi:phage/plasmid-like protein (TIGR03299 family)
LFQVVASCQRRDSLLYRKSGKKTEIPERISTMAHEITNTDGIVLHREAAWHGLGTVVESAPTPREALKLAGLDWRVNQLPLYAMDLDSKNRIAVNSHVLNVRSDNNGSLGIVGRDYKPFHNDELADFCDSLTDSGDVRIESAGSIRGGGKVWFLLKGESFDARLGDEVAPYICVSNGHDGGTALRVTPTTVRVVCSNTLHMVIPRMERERARSAANYRSAAFVSFHIGDLASKVEEAKRALQVYGKGLETTRELITTLAARDVNSDEFRTFFLEAYARDFDGIPSNPKTQADQKKRDKALDAFAAVERRFESESRIAGSTLWNALNAYTGWLQNDRGLNYRDAAVKVERSQNSKLFGSDSDRTTAAFAQALSLVV